MSRETRLRKLEETLLSPVRPWPESLTDVELIQTLWEAYQENPAMSEECGITPEIFYDEWNRVHSWRNLYPEQDELLSRICEQLDSMYPARREAFFSQSGPEWQRARDEMYQQSRKEPT